MRRKETLRGPCAVINTEVGGQYMVVTLCPLTGTALNFNATDELTLGRRR